MKKKHALQIKAPRVIQPKKVPRQQQKVLPTLQKIKEPPNSARPRINSRRNLKKKVNKEKQENDFDLFVDIEKTNSNPKFIINGTNYNKGINKLKDIEKTKSNPRFMLRRNNNKENVNLNNDETVQRNPRFYNKANNNNINNTVNKENNEKMQTNPRFASKGNNNKENSSEFQSLPGAPLKPSDAKETYINILTEREKFEIDKYREIYYIRKDKPDPQSHMIYDPDFFPFIKDDHIKFQYQQIAQLGSGAFGTVIKCYDHKNHRIVALKLVRDWPKMHKQIVLEKEVLEILKEKSDIAVDHHCIRVYEIFGYRSFYVYAFEVLSINLYMSLKVDNFKGFDLNKIKIIAKQAALSLQFIHSLGLIHCDIKPENILWTSGKRDSVKLIDFGCCCHVGNTLHTYIQSRYYRAPEVMLGIQYGQPIDIWSFGCVLCELITGIPIFPGEDEDEQMALIQSVLGPPPLDMLMDGTRTNCFFDEEFYPILRPNKKGVTHSVSSTSLGAVLNINEPHLLDIIRKCLKWNPSERITFKEIVNHPWFNESFDDM